MAGDEGVRQEQPRNRQADTWQGAAEELVGGQTQRGGLPVADVLRNLDVGERRMLSKKL